jgi:16S rRNA (guanine1207-N2)-methyltransferase
LQDFVKVLIGQSGNARASHGSYLLSWITHPKLSTIGLLLLYLLGDRKAIGEDMSQPAQMQDCLNNNISSYYQTREFNVHFNDLTVRVVTKPGLPHWDRVNPSAFLLAERVRLCKGGQALLLGCGHGALGVALGQQTDGENLWMTDNNIIAIRMTERTLRANGLSEALVKEPHFPLPTDAFDTIVMDLPKGRKLARRWLVEAFFSLKPGGEFYLAGANQEGVQAVIKDAESLFGNGTIFGYKKGSRVMRMVKPLGDFTPPGWASPVLWASEPGIARGSWYEFDLSLRGENFHLCSLPGVFSYDRLDEGTALLLDNLPLDYVQDARVLDFGCGYGIIGMWAARLGATSVDLVDADLWAVTSAQENLTCNGIANGYVRSGDVLDSVLNERYDLILSNPPFHSGKDVEYAMSRVFIAQAHQILQPGGRLVVVANKFIRYDRLMENVFGNVARLAETGKYHVLEVIKR